MAGTALGVAFQAISETHKEILSLSVSLTSHLPSWPLVHMICYEKDEDQGT